MKTPKKVIEKISLPLMFVTFVMAVLVFAVSPVSAAPDLCTDPDLVFCDQDGDGYIRDHKKCPNGCYGSNLHWPDLDCDDNDDTIFADCDNVDTTSTVYTAELIIAYEYLDKTDAGGASSGAFRFAEGAGPDFENITPPIEVIIGSNPKDLGLGPRGETDVEMWRPNCGDWEPDADEPNDQPEDYPTTYPVDPNDPNSNKVDIDGPGPWPNTGYENCTYVEKEPENPNTLWIPDWYLVETWDRMFEIGCPELGTSKDYKIERILSTYGNWDFSEPGNYRLVLRDIRLQGLRDDVPVDWDVTMQLIASDVHEWTRGTGDWLPDDADKPHLFFLTKGNMWGREVGGGQGGRQSCHKAPSGTEERMEGFFLWDWKNCFNEACEHAATSVMEIVILPPLPPSD